METRPGASVLIARFAREVTSMPRELKVISDFYDFMLWLVRHVEKFPRHHRYSLGRVW